MTDKPNTLALNARQWRVLMNDHLEVLKAGVAGSDTLNEGGLGNIVRHLEEVRLMATAWFQNSPKPEALVQEVDRAAAAHAAASHANGAAPKRKGGWPAGKPRKRAGAEVVQ